VKEDPEILEGEVVGKTPEKKSLPKNSPLRAPGFFTTSLFVKLWRNCLFALIAFFGFTILAIYFKNGWLFLLAILLPPWIFSQR